MTRPQIIRADTIDLQDPSSPSAQNHTRPTTNGKSERQSHGRHQDQAMRNAEQDRLDEIAKGPLSPDHRKDAPLLDEDQAFNDRDDSDLSSGVKNSGIDGYGSRMEDDEADGDIDDHLDDDLLDKISSSPSIDDEDIDFEFVYALHTFFATVEGQANATKGDTMVLLDDSNSYWWLVRVVKDGSIGYLPAEHIETPTERIARFNKHRNVDLSATMLGDNAEKSKNPLKKAIRRRHAKAVTFADDPTYVEASDIDYSTEEEDADDQFFDDDDEGDEAADKENAGTQGPQEDSKAGSTKVEPLRPRASVDKDIDKQRDNRQSDAALDHTKDIDDSISSQEDYKHGRSRNGIFRNTDSFFKDDNLETKKISLTPNLLRDDTTEVIPAAEQKEQMRGRGSFETLMGDRSKDDKKRKDKKPGMLSGLFKRKDKKNRSVDEDAEDHDKASDESRSSTDHKTSLESLKDEIRPVKSQSTTQPGVQPAPQRYPSKTQKQASTSQAAESSSASKQATVTPSVRAVAQDSTEDVTSTVHIRPSEQKQQKQEPSLASTPAPVSNPSTVPPTPPSARNIPIQPIDTTVKPTGTSTISSHRSTPNQSTDSTSKSDTSLASTATSSQRSTPTQAVDSSRKPDSVPTSIATPSSRSTPTQSIDPVTNSNSAPNSAISAIKEKEPHVPAVQSQPDSALREPSFDADSIDELPGLSTRVSPRDDASVSIPSLSQPTPDILEIQETKPDTTAFSNAEAEPSIAASPVWNPSNLRAYFDDGSDIRDLLAIVHDKTNVPPAGPDHPVTGNLFKEENQVLAELSNRLDEMLNGWLARKYTVAT